MSVECKSSEQDNGDVDLESYRCNSCSIGFDSVEHLIEHTQEVHTEPDRGVTCGKCQLEFSDITEFLEHLRSVHLKDSCDVVENEVHVDLVDNVKCETLTLGASSADDDSVQIENGIPEQITIVNDNGETIGIAECDEDQVAAISAAHEAAHDLATPTHITSFTTFQSDQSRKRRLPAKFRDLLSEPGQSWKRIAGDTTLNGSETKRDELEIDVSGLSGIRLKTKSSSREEEILNYLSRVEEKLDCIIKHFNVPLTTDTSQRVSPFSTLLSKSSFRKSVPQRGLVNGSTIVNNITASLNVATARRPTVPNGRPEQDVGYISCDPPQPLPEVTQYVISDDLLEAVYMKSRNRGNFAKHLVFAAFPLEERLGRNCYGRRGGSVSGPKDPLEHAKLEAVREAVFKKFPVLDGDDMDAVWKRECVIAIDTALRSEMRTRILNMQNNIKHELIQNNMKHEIIPASIKNELKNGIGMNVTM